MGIRLRSKVEGSLEFSNFHFGVVSRFHCIHSLLPPLIPVNKVGYCASARPSLHEVSSASSVLWPLPTPFPQFTISPLGLIGSPFTTLVVRVRVSLVPVTTIPACQSLYTGEFFRAAYPSSSRVPWPSPSASWLGSLLSLTGRINDAVGFTRKHFGLQACFTLLGFS
jgi:hypothetical protein